jgi:hydrogenase/urease accessory protein HupE
VGAPLPTILAYLLALSAMQAALALAGPALLRGLQRLVAAPRRVAGGAVSAVGGVALVQALGG